MTAPDETDPLKPLNAEALPKRAVAVALQDRSAQGKVPEITAAGRGEVARQILEIAFQNGVKVREDADLAELLARFELDSPVPTEALMAVGEILAYIYQANGEPNPFEAVLKEEFAKIKEAEEFAKIKQSEEIAKHAKTD